MRNRISAAAVFAATLFASVASFAAPSDDEVFRQGVAALHQGAYEDAVHQFELLADRDVSHPDISFDRATAYVGRGLSSQKRAGDLGRAAAALEETLLLRPGDDEARKALERVREEIARRRVSGGSAPVAVNMSLGWAVVSLLGEDAWALAAALGSLLATVGLALRLWVRRRETRVAGIVMTGIGVGALVLFGALAALARERRVSSEPAVVVVSEARLLDPAGKPASGADTAIPEGALLRLSERRGQLGRVQWGDRDGWVAVSQLRLLRGP